MPFGHSELPIRVVDAGARVAHVVCVNPRSAQLEACYGVLRFRPMANGLEWLPDDGVVLTRDDLATIFEDLRALIAGTEEFEPNRAFAVDIAVTIARALERDSGDE